MKSITDLFNRPTFVHGLAQIIIFGSLCTVSIIVVANNWNNVYVGIPSWYVVLPAVVCLLAENAVKIWGVKKYAYKIACYVLDILILLTITLFTDGTLISTFYLVILSEFYIGQKSFKSNVIMGATSVGLFVLTLAVNAALQAALQENTFNVVTVVSNAFNDLMLLVLHFFILNFSIQLYRKNKEITGVLAELSENNEKLKQYSESLKEITVLEERQRIAKDIHDTAGHAITTVIIQTEAAKLLVDSDPQEAKRRIAAANLQAKHALEELRESVHLLSGSMQELPLRDMLEVIIRESSDGTDLVFRTDIDDLALGEAQKRFFCNTLKEGISNALRHGGATAFWFACKREGEQVHFILSDNGSGAEKTALQEGFGLSGMHRRAQELGGKIWFETEPGDGFELHALLPIGDTEEGSGS